MKFLCPKCQAKYQIAEDKIAGRSVKMKCRQCGELIRVGELVEQQTALASADAVAEKGEAPPKSVLASADAVVEKGKASALSAEQRRPRPAAVPRPQPARAASPALTSTEPLVGSSPRAAMTQGVVATVGSLKGAFQAAVDGDHTMDDAGPLAGDEWYVGIGEKPLGPIRLSEIRDRVMKGEIVEDSLVWRDGFEEWKPLRDFPELFAVLEEALYSAHPPRRAPPKRLAPKAGALAPAAAALTSSPDATVAKATTSKGIDERPGAVVVRKSSPTQPPAKPMDPPVAEGVARVRDEAADLAGISPTDQAAPVAPESRERASRVPQPLAAVTDEQGPSGHGQVPDSRWGGQHRIAHPALPLSAWFAILAAVVFGIVIGVVLFGNRQGPAEARTAATAALSQGHVPSAEVVTEPIVAVVASAEGAGESREEGSRGGVARRLEAAPGPSVAPAEGLKGLSGLRGSGAPQSGPAAVNEAPQSAAGRPLDSDTLSRTVSRYTPSIRRSCWIPALDSRAANAPSSARVQASITVAPSGRVQAVTTSGDPRGYTGLALCIQSRIRAWEFPASSGSTQVNVPFVFAVQ